MVDLIQQATVCCMCGDVGFPDKLFRCHKCRHRFQHSYCSSYYGEVVEQITVCDWCESEARNTAGKYGSSSSAKEGGFSKQSSEFSGKNIKQHNTTADQNKHPRSSGTPSPRRPSPRKYKLLKDVMC